MSNLDTVGYLWLAGTGEPTGNSEDQKQWMTPYMRDESEKGVFMAEVRFANSLLEQGVEDFSDFVKRYRTYGGTLLIGYLRELYDEYWSDINAEKEETRATGN